MQKIYEYVLISENLREYKLRLDYYLASDKNLRLNKRIERLEAENKKFKKEISSSKKFKKEILSSKSWKLTKPLRKMKKLIK